jgi:hypothetical protein
MTRAIFLAFSLLALLAACRKDPYGRSVSLLANSSAHQVRLLPFVRDSAYAHLAKGLSAGDSLEVNRTLADGKVVSATWTDYLQQFDSVQVFFIDTARALPHDTVHIGHLRNGTVVSYQKHIPYSSLRNLYNPAAWTQEVLAETGTMLSARFTYTFTEADYQAAR